MGWLRRSENLAARTDPLASWGERAIGLVLWVIGPSTVLSVLLGLGGWILANPYAGLVIGLASWIALAILLLLIMAKRAGSGAPPATTTEPETTTPQPPSTGSDSDQTQEVERLREILMSRDQGLKQAHGQIEQLITQRDALEKELEEARSAPNKTGKGTTPADHAERSTVAIPNLGETVRMKAGARLTVHTYEVPVPLPSWYQQLTPGYELLAIDVEAYAGSNPEDYLDHIQLSDFQLQMPDNTRLRSTLSAKEPTLQRCSQRLTQ